VCTTGFDVHVCCTQVGVTVRYWPEPDQRSNLADHRTMLARYAEVIAAAGWEVDLARHELIVRRGGSR